MGNQVKFLHPEMASIMGAVRERIAACGTFSSVSPEWIATLSCMVARPLADRRPEDVTWAEICGIGRKSGSAAGAALVFALTLLDEGMFEAPLADALRSWRPHVEAALASREGRHLLPLYLCGSCVEWLAADPGTARFTVSMFSASLLDSFAELGEDALNPDMVPLLREVAETFYGGREICDIPKATLTPFKRFFAAYASRSPQGISWEEECAARSRSDTLTCPLLALFTVLLDAGLYAGDHREALEKLNGSFKALMARDHTLSTGPLMCGEDVEYLCALPSNIAGKDDERKKLFMILRTGNPYLRDLLAAFLQEDATCALLPSAEKVDVLLRSMGAAADGISRLEDFTASLFWRQVRFIRDEFAAGTRQRTVHAGFLRGFYRYLAGLDPERDLFANATSLSTELLHSNALTEFITRDWLVTSFHPGIDLGDAKRVALIVRGYGDLSTNTVSEDWVTLDVSSLECPFYRRELLAFACRSPQAVVGCSRKQVRHTCRVLQGLFEAKGRKGYPNPGLETVSRAETALIRKSVERSELAASTKAGVLNSVRAFFQWERDSRKRISFEEFAIDSLYGPSRGKSRSDARAAPREHLAQLSELLAEKGRGSLEWGLANAVFHLLLQTEFRIGQICHLDVGCARPTAKPNEHVICSTTKTSRGEREELVVTQRTLDVLNGATDATEEVRRRFAKRSTSRYVFIYEDEHGYLRRMTPNRFSNMLAACCGELGIEPPYTPGNLRDTHETLAVGFATDANGEMRPDAALLSGHVSIATTLKHYVDVDIEEMIAATFDVYIGDNLQVDADGKVVEAIPEEARGADRVVEGGCGSCTAQYCSVTSPLPCLVCESFVTTVDHEPFFVRMIEAVDAQLQHAASRHDAEDLTTVKRLLAAYLAAIYRKKREREQRTHE